MKEVQISDLVAEGTTQARSYDEEMVERYAQAMKDGAVFPPVIAFQSGNGLYLADGFHRRGAALKCKRTTIEVDVRKPIDGETPQRSAILFAVGANDEHGHNRTAADKRHAVEMLLRDPEWSKWTDPEVARQCRVSRNFVQTHRTRLINSGALKKNTTRTTKRDGKEYEIKTEKIGKSKPKAKPTPEQKKVATQVRESAKKQKEESAWTKADEQCVEAISDSLSILGKAWQTATRAAQIHMLDVVRRTLKDFT